MLGQPPVKIGLEAGWRVVRASIDLLGKATGPCSRRGESGVGTGNVNKSMCLCSSEALMEQNLATELCHSAAGCPALANCAESEQSRSSTCLAVVVKREDGTWNHAGGLRAERGSQHSLALQLWHAPVGPCASISHP
jgi:hypothetical protein